LAYTGRRGFQLFDARQAAQGSQQAAQTANRGAQLMQCFRVGAGTQTCLTGQQTDFKAQDMSH
jgi:hypothetical protein